MDCLVCFEGLGDQAYCLPCGHIFCMTCISSLAPRRTRSESTQCPTCRQAASTRIGSDNIRKVFLSAPSDSLSPLSSDVDSSQATPNLAIMDREMSRLKAELEAAKAAMASMAATLFAKERAFQESEQRFSRLSREHHKEVTEHRQAQSELRAKDSEIRRLKEVQATTHSFSSTLSTHSQSLEVKPAPPKTRELKYGAEIRFRGYGRPQRTAVPECTAPNGCHYFSGAGTNGYATRYTCKICHFVCSESRR